MVELINEEVVSMYPRRHQNFLNLVSRQTNLFFIHSQEPIDPDDLYTMSLIRDVRYRINELRQTKRSAPRHLLQLHTFTKFIKCCFYPE